MSTNKQSSLVPPKTKLRSRTKVLLFVGSALLLVASSLIGYGVYQNQVNAANAYPSYLPGKGTLAFYDSLTQPFQWNSYANSDGTSCQFSGNTYHIKEPNINFYYCYSDVNFSNFAFEVQMTIIQGNCGGITFRGNSTSYKYYYYEICQNGSYSLDKYVNNQSSDKVNLKSDYTQFILKIGQSNKIAVVLTSNTIEMYVNNHYIDIEQDDNAYFKGQLDLQSMLLLK